MIFTCRLHKFQNSHVATDRGKMQFKDSPPPPKKKAFFWGGLPIYPNIFITTYPKSMILNLTKSLNFALTKNFFHGHVEISTVPTEPTIKNFLLKLWVLTGGKCQKLLMSQKNGFFSKSKISIHQSNHVKRNFKLMLVRPPKRFTTTCDVSEIIS